MIQDQCSERDYDAMQYKPSSYNIICKTTSDGKSLFFNTVSGAIAWMNSAFSEQLSSKTILPQELLDQRLLEKGFVVPENLDEFEGLIRDRHNFLFSENPERINFVLAPTMDCNLKCPYCFEDDGRIKGVMSSKTWEELLVFIKKQIDEHKSIKHAHISWFGGEPSIKAIEIIDFSTKLIPFLNDRGISYSSRIVSNAVLLTKDRVKELHEKCHVIDAQFTVDGMRETYAAKKGCSPKLFEVVIQNIIDACEYFRVNLRINIDRENIHEVPELLAFLLEEKHLLGKVEIYFARVQRWNNSQQDEIISEREYVDFLKWIHRIILDNNWGDSFSISRPMRIIGPCNLVRKTNCVVAPDGKLYRCEHCINQFEWNIGDIQTGFVDNTADYLFLNSPIEKKCNTCSMFPLCGGGCLANTIIYGTGVDCEAFVEQVKENVSFVEQLKSKGGESSGTSV